MKSRLLFVLFTLLSVSISFGENEGMTFSSNSLKYYAEENTVILDSNVIVNVNKIKIAGDSLIFYSDDNVAKAYGKVNIKSKHQNIDCDSVYYNIKTKKGVIFGGVSHVPQGLFKGKIITQDSNRVLEIYDARFTTCDRDPPDYYFFSDQIKMYEDNYALVRPLIMYVHDIPVFYAPFWFFPVREERHSGFLVPSVGASANEGKFVKNISYFWAMNPFMDATFTVNIMELKGVEGIINYEYLLKPILKGNADFSYINEFTGHTRWKIDIKHEETVFGNGRLLLNGKFFSDNNVEQDYNDSTLVILDKEIYSYLSFSKRFWKINTNTVIENRKNLLTNEFHNQLPFVSISFPSYNLFQNFHESWFGGTYFSFGDYFRNSYDSLGQTISDGSNVSLSSNFKLFRYFKLSHTLSSGYSYVRDSTLRQNVILRNRVGLYTNIYGFTKYPFFNIKKIRQTITPMINFSYYNSYVGKDTGYAGPVELGLRNIFEAKLKSGNIVRLLTLNMSSSYSLQDNLFSRVKIDGQTEITRKISVRANTEIDPYTLSLQNYSVTVSGGVSVPFFSNSMDISATYNIGNNLLTTGMFTNAVDLHIKGKITHGWSVDYSGRMDLVSGNIVNQQVSIVRDLHCWELTINYQTFASNYRLDVNLHIKKLPTVKIGSGLFDIFGL